MGSCVYVSSKIRTWHKHHHPSSLRAPTRRRARQNSVNGAFMHLTSRFHAGRSSSASTRSSLSSTPHHHVYTRSARKDSTSGWIPKSNRSDNTAPYPLPCLYANTYTRSIITPARQWIPQPIALSLDTNLNRRGQAKMPVTNRLLSMQIDNSSFWKGFPDYQHKRDTCNSRRSAQGRDRYGRLSL